MQTEHRRNEQTRQKALNWYHSLDAPELLELLTKCYPAGPPPGGIHGCDIESMYELHLLLDKHAAPPPVPARVINLRPWFFILGLLLAFIFCAWAFRMLFCFCN